MSKIGFFGGSFNPPTIAHFEIVNNAIKKYNLDKVVIIPMGDKYQKPGLVSFEHRYKMLLKMFKDAENVEISNMQENQKEVSYAIDCFNEIDEKYKNDERFFIMGQDNYSNINKWKDPEKLVLNRNFIVFERNDSTSSSLVRQKIKSKGEFKSFTLPEVAKYIDQQGLYK